MRTVLFIATIGAIGCAEPPPHDLELRGTLATGHDLHVGLIELGSEVLVHGEWFPFERPVTYGSILDAGASYRLYLYADRDGDGRCSAPPRDHVWKLDLIDVRSSIQLDLGAIEQDGGACAFFANPPR